MYGKPVEIKVLKLYTGARRESKLAQKYIAFDGSGDFEVTIDGQTETFINFAVDVVPEIARGKHLELMPYIPVVGLLLNEFLLGSVYTVDYVIPIAVKAAMEGLNEEEVKELAKEANQTTLIAAGIPGVIPRARNVARLACKMLALQEN